MDNETKERLLEGQTVYKDSCYIKLSRGMKGTYGWDLKVLSNDVNELKLLNEAMIEEFGDGD